MQKDCFSLKKIGFSNSAFLCVYTSTRWGELLRGEHNVTETMNETLQSLCQIFEGRFAAENVSEEEILQAVGVTTVTNFASSSSPSFSKSKKDSGKKLAITDPSHTTTKQVSRAMLLPAHTRAVVFTKSTQATCFALALQTVSLHVRWDIEVLTSAELLADHNPGGGSGGRAGAGVGVGLLARRPNFSALVHCMQFSSEGAALAKGTCAEIRVQPAATAAAGGSMNRALNDDDLQAILSPPPRLSPSKANVSSPPLWHEALLRLVKPGQVMATAESWLSAQDIALGNVRLIDLGIHLVQRGLPVDGGATPWLGLVQVVLV